MKAFDEKNLNDAPNLDLLFVNPTLDWKMDLEKKQVARIEKNIPNQETPHIGIAYLLAVAKKEGLRAKYLDMVMEGISLEQLIEYVAQKRPSLIGLTAFTVQARTAGIVAQRLKALFPSIKVCLGGPHASALPKETLEEYPEIDFVCSGEGESLLRKLKDALGDLKQIFQLPGIISRTQIGFTRNKESKLDDLPFPAWDMFDLTKYQGTYPHRTKLELPMITGRGCPFKCTFCCRSLGDSLRRRSVPSVMTEIEHHIEKFKCESIAFLDETFIVDKDWIGTFLETMIEKEINRQVTWSCSTRVSNMTPSLLKKMKAAGCYYIFYGLESADNEILKRINKGITVEQMKNAIQWTKEAGILPVGAFIIGLEGDTEDHVIKAINLAQELDLYSVTFPIAVPFPGTKLREMALRNEYGMRIISDNWDDYGKQNPGVLESRDLPWDKRRELQRLAYARNPKKELDKYINRMKGMGYPY